MKVTSISPEREQIKPNRTREISYHMTGRVDSDEREAMRTACLARHMTVDVPLAQWERRKVLLAMPVEREGPRLVSDPVTYPIVRPDVDEHAHLAR